MMKRIKIVSLDPGDFRLRKTERVFEIFPQCVESIRELDETPKVYQCRTLSGETFYVDEDGYNLLSER